MGYLYHVRKCGKEAAELEKLTLKWQHCGKPYRSKAGLAYHMRSEHGPVSIDSSLDTSSCIFCESLLPHLCPVYSLKAFAVSSMERMGGRGIGCTYVLVTKATYKKVFNQAHGFRGLRVHCGRTAESSHLNLQVEGRGRAN